MNANNRKPPFERIVFDCDSTLSTIEGIDELARQKGIDVADLTNAAMAGELPFDEVYQQRLERIQPTRDEVLAVGQRYIENPVETVAETIEVLQRCEKELWIVSGGLEPAVQCFGQWLGIAEARIVAVPIEFAEDGRYLRYNAAHPLANNGGKKEFLAGLPVKRTAFVGDGMTDAEARDFVSCFVHFGGVVDRPQVAQLADYSVNSPRLIELLDCLLDQAERKISG